MAQQATDFSIDTASALAEREQALGPEHPHLASTLEELAATQLALGDYDTAPDIPVLAEGIEKSIAELTSAV